MELTARNPPRRARAAKDQLPAANTRYGATDYRVYRNRDDRYKFLQTATFEDKNEWQVVDVGKRFRDPDVTGTAVRVNVRIGTAIKPVDLALYDRDLSQVTKPRAGRLVMARQRFGIPRQLRRQ